MELYLEYWKAGYCTLQEPLQRVLRIFANIPEATYKGRAIARTQMDQIYPGKQS